MASKLNTKITSYAIEKTIEFDEAYATTPTQTGSFATNLTFSLTGTAPTRVFDSPPGAGNSSWEFQWTTSSTTNTYYNNTLSTYRALFTDADYSVGFWFKAPALPSDSGFYRILEIGSTSTAVGFYFDLMGSANTNGGFTGSKFRIGANASPVIDTYTPSTLSIVANKWYYIAIRRVGSTGNNYFVYVDGAQVANFAAIQTGSATRVSFGRNGAHGQSGTYRISNFYSATSSAIGATEIAAIYQDGSFGYEKGLQTLGITPYLNYQFSDSSGIDLVYSTGSSAQTLNLSNTPTWLTYPNSISKGGISFPTYGGYDTGALSTYGLNNTMAFWFKRPSPPATQVQWSYKYATSTTKWDTAAMAGINTNGTITFAPFIGEQMPALTSATNICNGEWHYVVITRTSGTDARMYIDGALQSSQTWNNTGMTSSTFQPFGGLGNSFDEVAYWDTTALTAGQISDLYASTISSINAGYTAEVMVVTDANLPMPIHTAETVIDLTYNSDILGTASADIINPALSTSVNVDGAHVIGEASATMVTSTVEVVSNVDYAHTVATASALMANATGDGQKYNTYVASPATASALLSANVFYGKTIVDNTYNLLIRQIGETTNTEGKNGFVIGSQWTNSTLQLRDSLLIRNEGGVPTIGTVVKAKFDPAWVSASAAGDTGQNNTFNIYVFTAAPANWTTFNYTNLPAKELISTSRLVDDGSNTQFLLDITAAANNPNAYTYGIFIEHIGTPPYSATQYDRTTYTGTGLDTKLMYLLTSDIVNKNINADVSTSSAILTEPTIYVERYVNFQDGVATASAEMANAIGSITTSADISASAMTASALHVNSTFNADVIYTPDHLEAFAVMAGFLVYAQGTVTLPAAPSTASAVFHMPQFDIGENNASDTMDASAILVMPTLIIPKFVDVMVTTASALILDPAVNAQLLGSYKAQPMTAAAIYPNPPAYVDLFGDPWYASLYAQHSVRNQLPTGYNTSFLKLFEDQNTDIAQSTPNTSATGGARTLRQLLNNLTDGIVKNTGPENDATFTPVSTAITDYSTAQNESRLSVGYFDPHGRKAVRLQNIGIQMSSYPYSYARTDFTMEFSIKTTKSNQIISYGDWLSQTSSQRVKSTFNLVDGKLNFYTHSGYYAKHPKEILTPEQIAVNSGYDSVTGNTRIDDGQWHHIIMQYTQGSIESVQGTQGRTQIWIDGNLDIQRFDQRIYEPDFIGANLELSTYAPDFYTSAWSMDSAAFVSERDIDLHYFNYIKYEPILAEPMTASITMTQDNTGKGNRGRALMLYWWPTTSGQNQNLITSRFDSPTYSSNGEFDINMFDTQLETIDYINQPPQQYYGWDVFPVDITGYYVSDLVKDEAYGGSQNIFEQTAIGIFTGETYALPKFKANRMGYFRDTLDDTRRYIDLVNDIDLSKFDAIFFKNYPDQSNEVDAFARNEVVDPYFNIIETKIYQDFVKSLRAAVDTGISLMVNNPQLALDLKIVDRIEVVPDLQDTSGYQSDPYTPTILPNNGASLPVGTGNTVNIWEDTFKNNRIRLINTVTGLTDWRCNIFTKAAYWENDDTINYGGANRPFKGFEHRPTGLQLGDEFFIPTFQIGSGNSRNYLATPISNVKAGTPLTAFASTYYKGLDPVDNPYKNYVTSIAVKPGDVLDGRQVGGKIFVNFTDAISQEDEYVAIDAIHTDWINIAYQDGAISLSQRNAYLASPNLLENQLSNGQISQGDYDKLKLWQSNGMFILSQAQQLESGDGKSDFTGDQTRKGTIRKTNRLGTTSTATVSFGGQFFTFSYSRQYDQLVFDALSMTTRGFRWLSDRVAEVAQTQTHTAFAGSAEIIQPTIIVQKEVILNVQSMVANATKIPAVGFAGNDVAVLSLPFTATAIITEPVKKVSAAPMTASAEFREQTVIRTTAQDQVVLYILHEDPILYLREDIIK